MQRNSGRLEMRGCGVALSEAQAGLQLLDLKVFLNTKVSNSNPHSILIAPVPSLIPFLLSLSLSFYLPFSLPPSLSPSFPSSFPSLLSSLLPFFFPFLSSCLVVYQESSGKGSVVAWVSPLVLFKVTPAIWLPSPYPNSLEDLQTSVLSTYLVLPPWTYSSEERKRTPFFPWVWGAW